LAVSAAQARAKSAAAVCALRSDVVQVQVRGVEQLELTGGPIARREHVRECGAVLLGEAGQHVAPLLDGAEALGIAFDRSGVVSRGLGELRDVRERSVQELLPLGH